MVPPVVGDGSIYHRLSPGGLMNIDHTKSCIVGGPMAGDVREKGRMAARNLETSIAEYGLFTRRQGPISDR